MRIFPFPAIFSLAKLLAIWIHILWMLYHYEITAGNTTCEYYDTMNIDINGIADYPLL
jgi:hypothetical protein